MAWYLLTEMYNCFRLRTKLGAAAQRRDVWAESSVRGFSSNFLIQQSRGTVWCASTWILRQPEPSALGSAVAPLPCSSSRKLHTQGLRNEFRIQLVTLQNCKDMSQTHGASPGTAVQVIWQKHRYILTIAPYQISQILYSQPKSLCNEDQRC